MSNKFLGESSVSLNSGSQEILGSTIGAVNLLSGTTVKVNSQHQLTSSQILITDVQGLSTAISGKLANPSSVPITAPSFVKSGGTSSQYLMADGTVTTGGVGATGPTGPPGTDGLSSSVFVYTFTTQTSGTPASGVVYLNDAPIGASQLFVSHLAKNGHDIDQLLNNVDVNSSLIVQRSTDSNIFAQYTVTAKTVFTGYVRYNITYIANSGSIGNNNEVLLIVQNSGPAGPQGSVGPTGATGATGSAGANASNPNFTASVTSSGTGVTPAVTLTGTYPNLALGFALKDGATGATGSAGAVGPQGPAGPASVNPSNDGWNVKMVSYHTIGGVFTGVGSGWLGNRGGSSTLEAQATTSVRTRRLRHRQPTSSVANGQDSGWYSTTGVDVNLPVYLKQGFKAIFRFGLGDTSTNASTRTFVGLWSGTLSASLPLFDNTTTIQSYANQCVGLIQEAGESTWSFYTKGASGGTKSVTSVPCTTPSTTWFTLEIYNPPGADYNILTLVDQEAMTTTTLTFTPDGFTVNTTTPLYFLCTRAMSSAGGITGSAIIESDGFKLLTC